MTLVEGARRSPASLPPASHRESSPVQDDRKNEGSLPRLVNMAASLGPATETPNGLRTDT